MGRPIKFVRIKDKVRWLYVIEPCGLRHARLADMGGLLCYQDHIRVDMLKEV